MDLRQNYVIWPLFFSKYRTEPCSLFPFIYKSQDTHPNPLPTFSFPPTSHHHSTAPPPMPAQQQRCSLSPGRSGAPQVLAVAARRKTDSSGVCNHDAASFSSFSLVTEVPIFFYLSFDCFCFCFCSVYYAGIVLCSLF